MTDTRTTVGRRISRRERWLMIALPAVLIVGGYAWHFHTVGSLKPRHAQAAEAVEAVEPTTPLATLITRHGALEDDVASLAQRLRERQDAVDRVQRRLPTGSPLAIATVGRVLGAHRMTLLSDGPADHAALPLPTTKANPTLWQVRVEGGFLAMHAAMGELARSEPAIHVVGLSMTATPAGPTQWTLTLWL